MMELGKELRFPSQKTSHQCNAKGWIAVSAGFILFAVTLSPSNSYNILFVTLQEDFNATAMETGAIGSLTFSSQLLSSAFAFILERSIGFRPVVILSTISCAGGLALSTLVNRMIYLYLTLGLLYGASTGICFHAVICILLQHFPQKNTRATATTLLGTTIGVLIYSQLLEVTLTAFGWRSSMLILAALIILPGLPVSFLVVPLKSFPDSHVGHEEHLTKMMGDTYRGRSRRDGKNKMKVPKEVLDSPKNVEGERLANYTLPPSVKWTLNEKEALWKELSRSGPSSSASDYYSSEEDIDRRMESKKRRLSITSFSWCGDCQIVLSMGRMWIFSIACIMSAMAWCVYFVNI
ncbi:Monocarboxylate transporter 9 [Holothuria leucospilota]|uniref:Monocarboxylate transporter 9 n=1 Tax=Holothuria leucospilota TaxID=206669 RepID=A0A9Q0YMA5_HOLLE|nr:Monocarboxylate transporter 9 [Holothuria leucospilota]